MGQKKPFTLEEIAEIEARLLAKENWHDLAMLSFGLDTMFRAGDLLSTQVWQVVYPNGKVRSMIPRQQRKTRHVVNPVLTAQTRLYLDRWLKISGKGSEDYVFTRTKDPNAPPIGRWRYADI